MEQKDPTLWKVNSIRDKVGDEGHVMPIGLPLTIFPENYSVPTISTTHALSLAMGKNWTEEYAEVISTVEGYVENSVAISDLRDSKKLSFNECCAITYYTCDVRNLSQHGTIEDCPFKILNTTLAKRDMKQLVNWIPFIYFLISGLNKLENTKVRVYRAIDKPLSQLSKQYQLGKTVCWVSFTSTTLDKNIMNSFISQKKTEGTFMQINVTEAKDIADFSLFPREQELLLLPNSHFVVDEVISENMKELMSLPLSIDGIILTQKTTPINLLLMQQNAVKKSHSHSQPVIRELPTPPVSGPLPSLSTPALPLPHNVKKKPTDQDTHNIPPGFPPPPPKVPDKFQGDVQEYKQWMRKRLQYETWVSGLTAYSLREKEGNLAACQKIIQSLKESLDYSSVYDQSKVPPPATSNYVPSPSRGTPVGTPVKGRSFYISPSAPTDPSVSLSNFIMNRGNTPSRPPPRPSTPTPVLSNSGTESRPIYQTDPIPIRGYPSDHHSQNLPYNLPPGTPPNPALGLIAIMMNRGGGDPPN